MNSGVHRGLIMFAPTPLIRVVLCLAPLLTASAAETEIWSFGKADHSDHEFGATPTGLAPGQEFVVRVGAAARSSQWPKFQPGSGNAAFSRPLPPYVIEFELEKEQLRGVFYLDLDLLFRQPRVPALDLIINGRHGRYYFDPEPMWELGTTSDQFNVLRSAQHRRVVLPAAFFKPGMNRIGILATDDPPALINNKNVGGSGDSGFYYDALALSHNPDDSAPEKVEVSLHPTVFFLRINGAVQERCDLQLRYPASWPGGRATIHLGDFVRERPVPKPEEFGEAQYSFLVPESLGRLSGYVDLTGENGGAAAGAPGWVGTQRYDVEFAPARKWKVFYAPNEHLDVGYTDYRAKVAEVHARCMDQLLETLAAHPQYRFNLDGSWIADQWLDLRSSAQTAQLLPHVRAGQVGMNAFYCSIATEYPSLEENIRNLYTSKELLARLGIPFESGLITDVPSVSWSVPSVLAAAGIRYLANGGNQDRGPMIVHGRWNTRSPFWWEGPDGERVLTWFSSHYHQFKALFGSPPAMESAQGGLARFLKAYEPSGYAPDAVLLYGTEVENLPIEYDDAEFVERWNQAFAWPKLIPCQFAEFFRYIEQHYGSTLPIVRGTGGSYWADNFGILAAATARDRANQGRVIAAETFAALACALDPKLRFPRDLDHEIWKNMLLYAEHNFGIGGLNDRPECDAAIGIVQEKEFQTVRAQADIDKLLRRGLSQLGDRIRTDGQNLLVFNPLSWTRSGLVEWQVDQAVVLTNMSTGQRVASEVLDEKDGVQTIRFWAENIPPVGYRVYRLGRGDRPAALGTKSPIGPEVVENRFYRVAFDPRRAALRSIYDKDLDRELVDSSSPDAVGEYLFVDGGGSEKGRGRGSEDSKLMHPFDWLPAPQLTVHESEKGSLTSVEQTPWGWRIRMAASALHTPRIETEILLPNAEKWIEVRQDIKVDLLLAKQASYFAFPWAAPSGRFRYDIPNAFVDPERELLLGGCSDWFSAQHLVNTEGENVSIDLAVPDAPLVCLGDICRGKWLPQFSRVSSTVFSYALNNYWSPKWAGKKSADLRYRYVIASRARFDPAQSARFGREASFPLEVAALKSSDKLPGWRGEMPSSEAALASIEPGSVILMACKPAEDGVGLVVRVLETAGQETDGTLHLPFLNVESARQANAVEDPGESLQADSSMVHFHIKPRQVLTLRITTKLNAG